MSAPITEADCVAFIRAKSVELAGKVGGRYVDLTCQVSRFSDGEHKIEWRSYVENDCHRSADTLAGALAATIAHASPAIRAADLRARAAEALAEAEKLEGSA